MIVCYQLLLKPTLTSLCITTLRTFIIIILLYLNTGLVINEIFIQKCVSHIELCCTLGFAPANISEHIGSSFDVIAPEMPTKPPENPTREDKNVVAEESSAASEIKQAVTSTVAV